MRPRKDLTAIIVETKVITPKNAQSLRIKRERHPSRSVSTAEAQAITPDIVKIIPHLKDRKQEKINPLFASTAEKEAT